MLVVFFSLMKVFISVVIHGASFSLAIIVEFGIFEFIMERIFDVKKLTHSSAERVWNSVYQSNSDNWVLMLSMLA